MWVAKKKKKSFTKKLFFSLSNFLGWIWMRIDVKTVRFLHEKHLGCGLEEGKKSTLVFWLDIFSSLLWKLLGLCVCVFCAAFENASQWVWRCRCVLSGDQQQQLITVCCSLRSEFLVRPLPTLPKILLKLSEPEATQTNSDCPFWDVKMEVNF